jgi:hypothetical protein
MKLKQFAPNGLRFKKISVSGVSGVSGEISEWALYHPSNPGILFEPVRRQGELVVMPE